MSITYIYITYKYANVCMYVLCIINMLTHIRGIFYSFCTLDDVRGLSFAVSLMVLLPPPPCYTRASIRTSSCLSQTAKNRLTSLFWRKLRFSRPGTKRPAETDELIFSLPISMFPRPPPSTFTLCI